MARLVCQERASSNEPRQPPLTRQMLPLIGMPFTVSTEKARRVLGYQPRLSWQEGIARMG